MTAANLPQAIRVATFDLLGTEMKVHILNNGMAVVDEGSMMEAVLLTMTVAKTRIPELQRRLGEFRAFVKNLRD